ncbi:TadE/TadG family type IV pilus assembly protein [Vibrio breoganii]
MRSVLNEKQKGLAAVEFILTVPLLLIILVAVLEISRAFVQYTEMTKNLQNAVRFGVTNAYTTLTPYDHAPESEIKNIALYGVASPSVDANTNEITSPKLIDSMDLNDITVVVPLGAASPNLLVTASVEYSPLFSTIPFTTIDLNFNMTSSAMMRAGP